MLIGTMFLLTLLVPLFSGYSYREINLNQIWANPSLSHWLGTDKMGRDILTRLFYGGRISLFIALVVEVIAFPIGTIFGYFSGTKKNFPLTMLNRSMDVLFSFPTIILALTMAGIIGIGMPAIIAAISLAEIPVFFRYTRTLVLKVNNERFMETLTAIGVKRWNIFTRHIVPHIIPPLLPKIIFNFATTIIFESTMSFIGIGIQAPLPSWGNMIRDGIPYVNVHPLLVIVASVILALTVLLLFGLSNSTED
jgi:ABC-type dipeptide/oligopeptide/nickel transport system permease subunit